MEDAASVPAPWSLNGAPMVSRIREFRHEIHSILKQATYDIERIHYNTVVSAAMKLLNAIEDFDFKAEGEAGSVTQQSWARHEALGILLRVLYPICPHFCHALWQALGFAQTLAPDILNAPWPEVDASALQLDEIELVLQINGKLRGALRVPATYDRPAIEAAARETPEVAKYGEGRAPKKVIVVPGRLVNVVV